MQRQTSQDHKSDSNSQGTSSSWNPFSFFGGGSNSQQQDTLPDIQVDSSPTPLLDSLPPQNTPSGDQGGSQPSFLREATAGVLGYLRANVVGDIPEDHEFKHPNRTKFHEDLEKEDVTPIQRRQLENQNYVQDLWDNDLPIEAEQKMMEKAKDFKQSESGGKIDRVKAHTSYMRDTIPAFTENGSSQAPWLLHNLGVVTGGLGVLTDKDHLSRPPQSMMERMGMGGNNNSTKDE